MKELEALILSAQFSTTLIDVVAMLGRQVVSFSPEAKERIRRVVFDNKAPERTAPDAMRDAWRAVVA